MSETHSTFYARNEDNLRAFIQNVLAFNEKHLGKLRKKSMKTVHSVQQKIQQAVQDAEVFHEDINKTSPTMDKYSVKVKEEVINTLSKIQAPEDITFASLKAYREQIESALKHLDRFYAKWLPKLQDKKFRQRIKRLDRAMVNINKELRNLDKLINKSYPPYVDYEHIIILASDLLQTLEEIDDYTDEILSHTDEIHEKEQELQELKAELKKIEEHPLLQELAVVNNDINKLRATFDFDLKDIKKALRKYRKIKGKQKNGLSKDDDKELGDFISDTPYYLASRGSALPRKIIQDLLKEPELLELKRDKLESALKQIDKLLSGKLDEFEAQAKSLIQKKQAIEAELEKIKLEEKKKHLEKKIHDIELDKQRITERFERNKAQAIENALDLWAKIKALDSKLFDTPFIDFELDLSE